MAIMSACLAQTQHQVEQHGVHPGAQRRGLSSEASWPQNCPPPCSAPLQGPLTGSSEHTPASGEIGRGGSLGGQAVNLEQ